MNRTVPEADLYALLAEFDEPEAICAAAAQARDAGFKRMQAYSPFPVHGLIEALGKPPTRLPYLTLTGGILGGITGYALQYMASVVWYPIHVGGRPLHSWPSFIPIVFELTILGAAFFSVLGMLGLSGLPTPYHPLFHVDEFKRASRDKFFLSIQTTDPLFDFEKTREFMISLGATQVLEVPQ